jgi:hypothetical protein
MACSSSNQERRPACLPACLLSLLPTRLLYHLTDLLSQHLLLGNCVTNFARWFHCGRLCSARERGQRSRAAAAPLPRLLPRG